jgi:hypothetical protein
MTTLHSSIIHAQPVNPIPHEDLAYTFCDGKGATLGCGDVGILHNIAILLKTKKLSEKNQLTVNRFHIAIRTMRRATHWDWVKSEHINTILAICEEIHDNYDTFITIFKEGQQFILEVMEKSVETGTMEEGDYLSLANGLKKPYDFITDPKFKEWVKGRAEFYKSLNGAMPNIKLFHLPQFNEHDGKCIMITA